MSNSFKMYPTDFSWGGAKNFLGGLIPPGFPDFWQSSLGNVTLAISGVT